MRKKLITMLMATSMVATLFAGCGQTQSQGESQGKEDSIVETSTVSEEKSNFNAEGYPVVNEEITLNVLLGVRDSDNLVDPNEMPAVQRLEELTGINLEWEVVKESDFSTKVNLAFASDEYPDIILAPECDLDFEEYGVSQEILIPLDDLIAKYMPNYSERIAMEESDPTIALKGSDGKTYALGYMLNSSYLTSANYFINQTWLDNLKLETPKTVEDLADVLYAFKTQDPNGNGEADEIPIVTGTETGMNNVRYLLQLFGIPHNGGKNWIYIDENKQVQLSPAQDGFRECMEWLHGLYEKDVLDPEIFSQDGNTATAKLKTANVGFFSAYRAYFAGYDNLAENLSLWVPDENAKLYLSYSMASPAAYLTCTNENIEASVRVLDAMLEKEMMYSLYIGEKDHEMLGWKYNDEGKIENYNKYTTENPAPATLTALNVNSFVFAPGAYYAENMATTAARIEKEEYCNAYVDAGIMEKYSMDLFNLVAFSGEENQKVTLIQTEIDTAVKEHLATFIKEGVTDDSWNAFKVILENIGVDEYVQMYQAGIDTLNLE